MLRQPHREGAQAAQRQEHVVGTGADAEQFDGVGDQRPRRGIGRDGPEHDAFDRHGDGRVARGAGLVLGQRPVGRPEPQRQASATCVLADLRAGVDVEQLDVLQQLAGAVADRVDDRLGGDIRRRR